MQPVSKMNKDDYKNLKVREFMKTAEKQLRKKIEDHNIYNLTASGEDAKEFEDIDLKADVVDERIEKQIAGRLNEELRKVKKGSLQYQ